MSIISKILKPFSGLLSQIQKNQQLSAGKQLLVELDRIDPKYRSSLLRVLADWQQDISFQRYNPRRAETTEYRGFYPRLEDLYGALVRANSSIANNMPMVLEDIKESPQREYTLDYFLSDSRNYSLDPALAFEELLRVMTDNDNLLASMELSVRKEHYVNHYQTMQRDGLLVLEQLARLSDIVVAA